MQRGVYIEKLMGKSKEFLGLLKQNGPLGPCWLVACFFTGGREKHE